MVSQTNSTALGGDIRPITTREFALFRDLIHREAGIHLSEVKKPLVMGRLSRRLRALGFATFADYYRYLVEDDPDERIHMVDCICTNETHFFREPEHFRFLRNTVFPKWEAEARRRRCIRVWSAACSTGEEPYSLAMMLLDRFPAGSGWDVRILATDISTKVLKHAQRAIWPMAKAAEIPPEFLKRFMLRGEGPQDGYMKAGPDIRSVIDFQRLNLHESSYPVGGPFDLIFCRNVLIYFEPEGKAAVVERVLNHLGRDGYLFVGHAESLNMLTDRVSTAMPTVYTLRTQPNSRSRERGNGSPERK